MSISELDDPTPTRPATTTTNGQKRRLPRKGARHSTGSIVVSIIVFIFVLIGILPIISIILGCRLKRPDIQRNFFLSHKA